MSGAADVYLLAPILFRQPEGFVPQHKRADMDAVGTLIAADEAVTLQFALSFVSLFAS